MDKVWTIIIREYLSKVKKKSFLVLTFLTPFLITGFYIIMIWFMFSDDDKLRSIAVINQSTLEKPFENTELIYFTYFNERSVDEMKDTLLHTKKYHALVVLSENLVVNPDVYIYSEKQIGMSVSTELRSQLRKKIETIRLTRIVEETQILDLAEKLKKSEVNLSLNMIRLQTGGTEKQVASEFLFGVGIIVAFMIYFIIFLYGSQVMRSILEEKTSRIVEIIISSVKPFKLMIGKIMGTAMVSLTQILIWIMTTAIIFVFASMFIIPLLFDTENMDTAKHISSQLSLIETIIPIPDEKNNTEMLVLINNTFDLSRLLSILFAFVFYAIFGYLLYAALFAAIGSAVDNETDTQQFMLPVTIPLIFALYIAFGVARNPDSNLAFWASVFPFTSPIVMPVRITYGILFWEIILSVILLILAFLGTVWISAKIYRTGILMYGKKVNYKEIWRWIRQ